MSDDSCPLPWTSQQWADLRAAAQESAHRSRVASTFLPLVGPLPADQATVPSNWMTVSDARAPRLPGEAEQRIEVRAGKTLHLVTASCNVYLRGSEVADPELSAAKAMVRRAAEVLGRVEDAVVFHGVEPGVAQPMMGGTPVVQPVIYTVTGGRDLTGLLQAPDTDFLSRTAPDRSNVPAGLQELRSRIDELADVRRQRRQARAAQESARTGSPAAQRNAALRLQTTETSVANAEVRARQAEVRNIDDLMCVRVAVAGAPGDPAPIVESVVAAIEKLERRGHFGPFAVVLGHTLFRDATSPSRSLVLPSDRLAEFLDGRRVQRSGALPPDDGVVVALGGEPIELVLARDVDIRFLQVTMQPRHVLRVFERFVLRIKELDAVCRITRSADLVLNPDFAPRRAGG